MNVKRTSDPISANGRFAFRCRWLAARDDPLVPFDKTGVTQLVYRPRAFRYHSATSVSSPSPPTRARDEDRAGTGARDSTRVSSSGNSDAAPAFAPLGASGRRRTRDFSAESHLAIHRRGCFPAASSARVARGRERARAARAERSDSRVERVQQAPSALTWALRPRRRRRGLRRRRRRPSRREAATPRPGVAPSEARHGARPRSRGRHRPPGAPSYGCQGRVRQEARARGQVPLGLGARASRRSHLPITPRTRPKPIPSRRSTRAADVVPDTGSSRSTPRASGNIYASPQLQHMTEDAPRTPRSSSSSSSEGRLRSSTDDAKPLKEEEKVSSASSERRHRPVPPVRTRRGRLRWFGRIQRISGSNGQPVRPVRPFDGLTDSMD